MQSISFDTKILSVETNYLIFIPQKKNHLCFIVSCYSRCPRSSGKRFYFTSMLRPKGILFTILQRRCWLHINHGVPCIVCGTVIQPSKQTTDKTLQPKRNGDKYIVLALPWKDERQTARWSALIRQVDKAHGLFYWTPSSVVTLNYVALWPIKLTNNMVVIFWWWWECIVFCLFGIGYFYVFQWWERNIGRLYEYKKKKLKNSGIVDLDVRPPSTAV